MLDSNTFNNSDIYLTKSYLTLKLLQYEKVSDDYEE